jgi:hypothetical protein
MYGQVRIGEFDARSAVQHFGARRVRAAFSEAINDGPVDQNDVG